MHGIRARHCTSTNRSGFDKQVDRLQILPRVAETANPKLLVWSAQDEKGLQRLCAAYENYINNLKPMKNEACFLANLSFTLATKRTSMPWKAFLAVHSIAQMKEHLNRGLATPRRSVPNPGITFVFTGQGAEWTGMGKDLLGYATFRKSLELSQVLLSDLGCSWRLLGQQWVYPQL